MAVVLGQETRREMESTDGGPLPMQFFSTWEVRKVPANCMSRLCTLNITKLDILQPLEEDLQSVVLAISMKVFHLETLVCVCLCVVSEDRVST